MLASLNGNGNGASEEVAGAMIGTGVGGGCNVIIGNQTVNYPCGNSVDPSGYNVVTDCTSQGSFGCTVSYNGMTIGGTQGGYKPQRRTRSSSMVSSPSPRKAPSRRSFF